MLKIPKCIQFLIIYTYEYGLGKVAFSITIHGLVYCFQVVTVQKVAQSTSLGTILKESY